MAEVNAKDLTTKTAPASTDSMLLFGTTTNEGAKITVDNLANNILERLATKTFPNQVGGSSAATILAQLATLNSKFAVYNLYTNSNVNITGYVMVSGKVAVLWIGQVKNEMTYNVDYDGGTLPVTPFGVIHTHVKANDRDYMIIINSTTAALTIKCLTNSLPSNGKPSLNVCVPFILG